MSDPLFASRAINLVAAETGSKPDEIKSRSKDRTIVQARWAAMVAMHGRGISKSSIARRLGGRHQTTVLYGIRQAEQLALHDPAFAALIEKVRAA